MADALTPDSYMSKSGLSPDSYMSSNPDLWKTDPATASKLAIEDFKQNHPHVYGVMKALFNDATPAPGIMDLPGSGATVLQRLISSFKNAGAAAKAVAKSPGVGQIAAGAGQVGAGIGAMAHGSPEGLVLGGGSAVRGVRNITKGIKAAGAAAKAEVPNPAVRRVEEAFNPQTAQIAPSGPVSVPKPVANPGAETLAPYRQSSPMQPEPQPALPASSGGAPQPSISAPAEPASAPPVEKRGTSLSYEDTQDPEIARTLKEGATRTKKGETQVLRDVPFDFVQADPGNTIYLNDVKRYQENGYSVHPELRITDEATKAASEPGTEAPLTIDNGHHRIMADMRNGKESTLAWIPKEASDQLPAKAPEAPPSASPEPDVPAVLAKNPKALAAAQALRDALEESKTPTKAEAQAAKIEKEAARTPDQIYFDLQQSLARQPAQQ